jgi:Ca-activated chloride channel homolog
MSANSIRIDTLLDCPLLSDREVTGRALLVTVTVPQSEARVDRLPLNLALVVDRSGSMQGLKLDYVKRAACHILDLLRESDQVAVVAYDDEIQALTPSARLTGATREELKRKIREMYAGNSTALCAGWLTGAEQVAEHYLERGVNRALLLTDGLANVGETRPEAIARHASELRQRGVSTSTFGVGADYNHFLLSTVAERGGGQYHFIESPHQIPEMFQKELGELLSIEARQATLRVVAPSGVTLRLLSDLPHEVGAGLLHIPVGDLHAGREVAFAMEIQAPAEPMGRRLRLGLELAYLNRNGERAVVTSDVFFTYAPHTEAVSAPVEAVVLQKAAEMKMAAAEAQALEMAYRGDMGGGAQVLCAAFSANQPALDADTAEEYEHFAFDFCEQMSSPMDQKRRHAANYARRQSRTEPPTGR